MAISMGSVSLSVGTSNYEKTYTGGVKPDQIFHFYFSYDSSGIVTVRSNVSCKDWDFSTSRAVGYTIIDGETFDRPRGSWTCGKRTNSDFQTATKSIASLKTFTVTIHIDADSAGNGPTPVGGYTWEFSVSVPGIIVPTKCSPPTSILVNGGSDKIYVAPDEEFTISWSGASGGVSNPIVGYEIEWDYYAAPGWSNSKIVSTSATYGSVSVVSPSNDPAYGRIDIRITTLGALGSGYNSELFRVNELVYTVLPPYAPTVTITQSDGIFNLAWTPGAEVEGNPVSQYEIWYRTSTDNVSWGERTIITRVSSQATQYTWKDAVGGNYYQFQVVALGSKYWYSDISSYVDGGKADLRPTNCVPPASVSSSKTEPSAGEVITITWTSGAGGTDNALNGYELSIMSQGIEIFNKSVGASTLSYPWTIPESVSGEVQIKVRSKGSAGESFYSDFSTCEIFVYPKNYNPNVVCRFKKDGTIQCSQVIEDGHMHDNTIQFDGIRKQNEIVLNNGWRIALVRNGQASADIFTFLERIAFVFSLNNELVPYLRLLLTMNSSGGCTASVASEGSSEALNTWQSPQELTIKQVETRSTNNSYIQTSDVITLSTQKENMTFFGPLKLNDKDTSFYSDNSATKVILQQSDRICYSSPRISEFSGVCETNVITLNNGMKITFTYGDNDTPAGYTSGVNYLSFKDNTYGVPFLKLNIVDGQTVTAEITNESAWYSSQTITIEMISGNIGAAVPSGPCKWTIEFNGHISVYKYSGTGPIITNAVGGVIDTGYYDRVTKPSVRVYRDGTLRCGKIIEERSILDTISEYDSTAKSTSGTGYENKHFDMFLRTVSNPETWNDDIRKIYFCRTDSVDDDIMTLGKGVPPDATYYAYSGARWNSGQIESVSYIFVQTTISMTTDGLYFAVSGKNYPFDSKTVAQGYEMYKFRVGASPLQFPANRVIYQDVPIRIEKSSGIIRCSKVEESLVRLNKTLIDANGSILQDASGNTLIVIR